MQDYEIYTPEVPYADELPKAESINEDNNNKKRDRRKKDKKTTDERSKTSDSQGKGNVRKSNTGWNKFIAAMTGTSARIIFGIFLGCLCIYIGASFVSYITTCIHDQSIINNNPLGHAPGINNPGGEGGARLAEFLINEGFGVGSFVLIFWLGAMALKQLAGHPKFKSVNFTIKCVVALITVSLIAGQLTLAARTPVNWGGYHGRYVNELVNSFVGDVGSVLLCIFMVSVFVIICMRDVTLWIIRKKRQMDERRRERERQQAEQDARDFELQQMQLQQQLDDIRAGEAIDSESDSEHSEDNKQVDFAGESEIYALEDVDDDTYGDTDSEYDHEDYSRFMPKDTTLDSDNVDGLNSQAEDVANGEDNTMVVNVNQIDQSDRTHYEVGNSLRDNYPYEFPPFDILEPGIDKVSVDAEEQIENKARIRLTLQDFGIPITSIEATVGPTVTLYEIVPDKGVKIAKIRSLVDDIALSLAARGVRIIAPIPGKGTVGIEVANKDPQKVSMRTIIKSKKFQESKYILPMAIGSTISNDVYIADLAKMPHLLVAGATGQGKSVGLNAMIASLLYCKRPNELKFVMIDPKQVEFSLYNKLKDHYMAMIPGDDNEEPVITDMQRVEATLSSLCIEMDNRYNLLKNAHTRNIEEYNAKFKSGKLDPREGHRFLPYIVVVVDEFGDLIMVLGKNVEMPIARLAQKARAVGMHVIIATQRPSTNVITGIIKANFPARVSFKVSSGVDSKTILDTTGAQQLIGRGDMLIFNNSEMVRVQCAFIDTPEVENICNYVATQPYPQGIYELPEPILGESDGGGDINNTATFNDRDPLFEEVARRIVNSNTASTSSLQRHYSIGYNRAGKIMDQLEAAGIVGASQGGKPRAVLVDQQTLEAILSAN